MPKQGRQNRGQRGCISGKRIDIRHSQIAAAHSRRDSFEDPAEIEFHTMHFPGAARQRRFPRWMLLAPHVEEWQASQCLS
jgi:hypothetical protein